MAEKPNPFAEENEKLKEQAEKDKKAKEKAEKAAADMTAEVKKSMEALAGDKPDLSALAPLAKSVDIALPDFPEFVEKKAADPEIPEALQEQWTALQKSQKDQAEELAELKKAAEVKSYVEKASNDFANVPGMSHKEMGDLLQKAHAGEACGEDLEKMLKSVEGFVEKSELFKEQGSALSDSADSPMQKMEALAKERVQKSAEAGKPMSLAKAIVEVSRENPDLRREAAAQ